MQSGGWSGGGRGAGNYGPGSPRRSRQQWQSERGNDQALERTVHKERCEWSSARICYGVRSKQSREQRCGGDLTGVGRRRRGGGGLGG